MINPFNGEGIAYAMESAEIAAAAMAEAHQRGPAPACGAGAGVRIRQGSRPSLVATTPWVAPS